MVSDQISLAPILIEFFLWKYFLFLIVVEVDVIPGPFDDCFLVLLVDFGVIIINVFAFCVGDEIKVPDTVGEMTITSLEDAHSSEIEAAEFWFMRFDVQQILGRIHF